MEALGVGLGILLVLLALLIFWPRPVRRRKRRANRSYNGRPWWRSRDLY